MMPMLFYRCIGIALAIGTLISTLIGAIAFIMALGKYLKP